MAYEIQVSATNVLVSTSSTEYAVTVTSAATPNFTITNQLTTVTIGTVNTTATIYTDAVELVLGDLNNFWKGNWVSGGEYRRGDIVIHQYSQYFLDDFDANPLAIYTGTIIPPNDPTWIQFNWHEAPFTNLTVTNTATILDLIVQRNLTIGGGAGGNGLVINSTATFNGKTFFNDDATFNAGINLSNADLEVSSLVLNGKNLVRTKTTGTSNLSIGLTTFDSTDIFKSSSFNIFSNGKNVRYVQDNIVDISQSRFSDPGYVYNDPITGLVRWTVDNTIQLNKNYGSIEVYPRSTVGADFVVNAVIVNTSTAKLSAAINRNGGNKTTQFSFYRADGVNNNRIGQAPYSEIAVSSDGYLDSGQYLNSFVFLNPIDGIQLKAWQYPYVSNGGSTNIVNGAMIQNIKNDKIEIIGYGQGGEFDDLNPHFAGPANLIWQFKNNGPITNIGEINSQMTKQIHKFNGGYESSGGMQIAAVDQVDGNGMPNGKTQTRFAVGTIGNLGYVDDNRAVFVASTSSPYVDQTIPLSYVLMKGNFVAIEPWQFVKIETGYIDIAGNTQLRIGAGGIKFANTTTVQTVPFNGYDQGTL